VRTLGSVVVATVLVIIAVTTMPAAVTATVPVTRHILVVVPIVAYKVHRSTTSVVLSTMLAPVPFVAGRYVQVDRSG
jgi:hypothetical protein